MSNDVTFESLNLHPLILRAIEEAGYTNATPIQAQAIPVVMDGHDLMASAQTGTGKTAAFGLPIINNLDLNKSVVQALIIAPTRELCMQITNDLMKYSSHTRGVKIVAVYGGASITGQMKDIKNGANIVVATPGRLIDLIKRKAVNLM